MLATVLDKFIAGTDEGQVFGKRPASEAAAEGHIFETLYNEDALYSHCFYLLPVFDPNHLYCLPPNDL